jgi:glycosyltransferase involved in cell wall biosynthesis
MQKHFNKYPRVAILMCTYNGEKYLEEQLDSIKNQDYPYWTLYVSDDGSKDETLAILNTYRRRWGKHKLHILKGPQINFQANFLNLINQKKILKDFYFLSDQDDIWMPHKISHTLKKISKINLKKPFLYCARTTYISHDNKKRLGMSELFIKPPTFKNALVQSIAGGNTMCFNNALKNISQKFSYREIVSHDWWLYILCELSGGKTLYDKESTILYRQHPGSLIGNNTTFLAKLKRLVMLFRGTYRQYNSLHLEGLTHMNIPTSASNNRLIRQFNLRRDANLISRLKMIRELGIYRQSWDTHLGLYLGALFHKL